MLKESVKINLLKGRKRDYRDLLLEGNPFPASAISGERPMLNVDRESIVHHFEETIFSLSNSTRPSVTTIVGDYGDGKTHLLRLFKYNINSQLFDLNNTENNTLGIYVRTPGKNFSEFFAEVIEDIGRSLLETISLKILHAYIKTNKNEIKKLAINEFNEIESNIDLEIYLRNSQVLDLFKNIKQKEFSEIQEPDIVYALLFLAHPDYSSLAWRWFLGEKLTSDEIKRLLISSSIDKKEQAYKQFKNLLNILKIVGIKNIVFLVDELERIVLIPGLQKAQYHDTIRHMIDDSPSGTAYFFAVAPKQWNEITDENSALARRISENTMRLNAFSPQQIRELISGYIDMYRIEEDKSKLSSFFKNCPAEIAPFTEESITKIYDATQGNVFANLVLARKLIDYKLDNLHKVMEITPEDVEKVLQIYG